MSPLDVWKLLFFVLFCFAFLVPGVEPTTSPMPCRHEVVLYRQGTKRLHPDLEVCEENPALPAPSCDLISSGHGDKALEIRWLRQHLFPHLWKLRTEVSARLAPPSRLLGLELPPPSALCGLCFGRTFLCSLSVCANVPPLFSFLRLGLAV